MKLIAIGENVCDLYLSKGMMYPGGQCANTAVYASMRGAHAAYMGVFGSDKAAAVCRKGLEAHGVDLTRCRSAEGENGYCRIEHNGADRIFAGSNFFGVNRIHPMELTKADWDYIDGFDLIYTDCNGQVDRYLPDLYATGIPIAYDFSMKIADETLIRVAPYVWAASFSAASISDKERERKMKLLADGGAEIVLATVGEKGSYLRWKDQIFYEPAAPVEIIVDTLGAGDAYFAALICLLQRSAFQAMKDCMPKQKA